VQTINPPLVGYADAVESAVREFEEAGVVSLAHASSVLARLFANADPTFDYTEITAPPADALMALEEDIRLARLDQPLYRHVLEAVGARMPRIWRCLAPADKAVFSEEYLRLYYVFRHAMPIEAAEWLAGNLREGRIRVGRLARRVAADRQPMEAQVQFGLAGLETVSYDHLVLATGPEWNVTKVETGLIPQLLRDGIASPDPMGGFATRDFELAAAPNVFALGGNVRGEDFAVHSLPALVRHAKAIEGTIRSRLGRLRRGQW
jgi:uncharacterized NAD(P)/FAD-binding protein YdhS